VHGKYYFHNTERRDSGLLDRFELHKDAIYVVTPISILVALTQAIVPIYVFRQVSKGLVQIEQILAGTFWTVALLTIFCFSLGFHYRIDIVNPLNLYKTEYDDLLGQTFTRDKFYGDVRYVKYNGIAQALLIILGLDCFLFAGFGIYFCCRLWCQGGGGGRSRMSGGNDKYDQHQRSQYRTEVDYMQYRYQQPVRMERNANTNTGPGTAV